MNLSGQTEQSGLPIEIPPKRRQNFRRSLTAAAARGPIEWGSVAPQTFIAALVALHAARWESRGEAGVLADARVVEFHQASCDGLAKAGLVQFDLLQIGGQFAAARYGLRWRDRAASYMTGFDPAFEKESPLTILFGEKLRNAVTDGVREFSYLRGQESYKYLWGATDRWNTRRSFRRRPA